VTAARCGSLAWLLAGCRLGFDARIAPADAPPASDAAATDGTPDAPASPCFALYPSSNYLDGYSTGTTGRMQGLKLVSPSALHVTRIEVFTGEAAGQSMLGLWSHNPTADAPGTDLGTAAFTIALPDGWQGPDLAAPIDIPASTPFWMVWTLLDAAQSNIEHDMSPADAPEERGSSDGGATWDGPYFFYDFKLKLWCDGMHP